MTDTDYDREAQKDKVGDALKEQRFQMLKDIAEELQGDIVFPTSFDTALRLRKELQNPDVHIAHIAKFIALEPLISVKLIRMANSVAYSPQGIPAHNLLEAINRLGLNVVRSTTMAIAMHQLLRAKELVAFSDITHALWEHSLMTAAAAKILAKTNPRLNPESAMLAGLVHDLGAFYMLYRAVQYRELRIRPETVKYIIIEWHESIGETLLNALGLPEDIVSATIDHDRLLGLPSGLFSLKEVVYVSNMIAGAHPMWLKMPDDEISAFIIQVKEAYADFLPEIDASVKEMTEIFA